MLRRVAATWEYVAAAVSADEREPRRERGLRLLGNLKLNGALRLFLDYSGPIPDRTAGPQILNPQLNEIASAELAIDGEIEERQLSDSAAHFKPNSDRPNVLWLEWALLTDQDALVRGVLGTQDSGVHD